jgi:hypothetical protein
MGTTSLDLAAVRAAAQRIDAAAETVRGVVESRLGTVHLDAATAGRAHAAAGATLRTEIHRLAEDLAAWAYAAGELAAALRSRADGHAATENDAVAALR